MTINTDILNTAVVFDVLTYDMHYDRDFMLPEDIRMMAGDRICGPAFTVSGKHTPNRLAPYEERAVVIDLLGHMTEGCVEVLQPNYTGSVGTWGAFTATLARHHGCAAALIDGYTRDIQGLRDMNFPTLSRGACLVNGFGSGWQIDDFQKPVQITGRTGAPLHVKPGDYVVGDLDGAVIIPSELLEEVVEKSEKRMAREYELEAELKKGSLSPEEWKKTIFSW